eukprot:7207182-Prymnesium_polylepis.1
MRFASRTDGRRKIIGSELCCWKDTCFSAVSGGVRIFRRQLAARSHYRRHPKLKYLAEEADAQ